MARLPRHHRERLEPMSLGAPFDYAPFIEQARAAGGPLLVWGGDGTVHFAGRALVAAGCPVSLGVVPGGSGNGLVRGLRTPLDPAGAVVRLLEGRDLAMDLPRLDGVPFLNVAGTGFEAAVARAFEGAGTRGFRGYLWPCLGLWRGHLPVGLDWADAELPEPLPPTRRERLRAAWRGPLPVLPDSAWSLCFANLPQYGSGFWIAPGADPSDGVLQWVRLHRPGWMDLLQLPALLREKGHTRLREEGRLRRATLRLDRPMPWHLDGEPAADRDRAEITLEPRAFPMRVTGDCPWV
jgi:diacylglycerol kinase family enzyme